MGLISVVVVLIIVGVLLYLVETQIPGFYVAVPDAYADYSLLQQAWVEQIALRMFPSEAAPELVGVLA